MNIYKSILLFASISTMSFSAPVLSDDTSTRIDMFKGHFSMDGNSGDPTKKNKHNIYIKFFKGQWIATMFIPLPYAKTVSPDTIDKAFENAKQRTKSAAYLRGDFDHLQEKATVHVETIGYLEEKLTYECGSLAPCDIRFKEGYLELIKPGMLNEHIIKFDHVF